ncbi:serine pyruvate aminotransferase [Trichuris trichiura]|uniref:Alanine--glyoxylate aminotransferase n=1 Tax=Trichuris trichiura TaxID=36087 RepID=A0A077YYM1_TRITR|nr:serine pyruvate aminotransferase [Trichuris trichiura]
MPPRALLQPCELRERYLFGPGPTNLLPSAQDALTMPMTGYLHADFTQIMDEVKAGLQYMFQTRNRFTMAITGSGHAAMEASLVNLLEHNEKLLVMENGMWGERAAEMGLRMGLRVNKICRPPGEVFTYEEIRQAIGIYEPRVLFVCHGESSTGALQPLDGLGELCSQHDCLLLVDMVMSLGATTAPVDMLGIDCAYSASQKVLSCPAGLSPITLSDRAMKRIFQRKTNPSSFYLDLALIGNYWGCFDEPRKYHHTACMPLVYAVRESLRNAVQEGLDNVIHRHESNAKHLYAGLKKVGFRMLVQDEDIRLPSLTGINVLPGQDWKQFIQRLFTEHNIEIAGGLGATVGKIYRIGLMGHNSTNENVTRILRALKAVTDM